MNQLRASAHQLGVSAERNLRPISLLARFWRNCASCTRHFTTPMNGGEDRMSRGTGRGNNRDVKTCRKDKSVHWSHVSVYTYKSGQGDTKFLTRDGYDT